MKSDDEEHAEDRDQQVVRLEQRAGSSTQFAPSCTPAQTSRIDQGSAPSVE